MMTRKTDNLFCELFTLILLVICLSVLSGSRNSSGFLHQSKNVQTEISSGSFIGTIQPDIRIQVFRNPEINRPAMLLPLRESFSPINVMLAVQNKVRQAFTQIPFVTSCYHLSLREKDDPYNAIA
jgi:hypothetical protein